jgi:hypothetical protein
MIIQKKQISRVLVSGAITVILYFFLFQPIFEGIKYKHRIVKTDYSRFLWLLNDSIKLDNSLGNAEYFSVTGLERDDDQYFNYNLEGGVYVHILEFKDLGQLRINEVTYNYNGDLSKFKKNRIGIFNEDVVRQPIISIKFKLPFHNSLIVNFNPNAHINEVKNTPYCKAFFGSLDYMSLSNDEDEHLVLFDFSKAPEELIAFYTINSRFFVFIITSDHSMDESYIKLLKLK